MFAKVLLPVFAVISVAAAQTASVCSQATATINSQADATALSSCSTISGSILIGSSAAGDLSINGPQQVLGSVIAENAGGLTSLASTSITSIGKSFTLTNLTLLSTLSFTELTSVNTILWTALPALPGLTFPATISTADSITISNTYLYSLDGINVDTVTLMQIDNNNQMKTFSTQVSTVKSAVNINANGNSLAVSFPNLIWAANMTLRNISSVTTPSLAAVNGSLSLVGNSITSYLAPNLTSIGSASGFTGSLALVANSKLANISFPLLKTIGGAAQIANNTALHSISFPALTLIGGALTFAGNFTTPSLPALTNVRGGFSMVSTDTIDCSGFKAESGSGNVIQGTFTCTGGVDAETAATATGTGTSGGASATGSAGAAASYGISGPAAALSVVGGLLSMLL